MSFIIIEEIFLNYNYFSHSNLPVIRFNTNQLIPIVLWYGPSSFCEICLFSKKKCFHWNVDLTYDNENILPNTQCIYITTIQVELRREGTKCIGSNRSHMRPLHPNYSELPFTRFKLWFINAFIFRWEIHTN